MAECLKLGEILCPIGNRGLRWGPVGDLVVGQQRYSWVRVNAGDPSTRDQRGAAVALGADDLFQVCFNRR